MEMLKFNSNGQWTLVKSKDENDYKSYRSLNVQGQLPEDLGAKGQLHNVGNSRPPRTSSKNKMKGKVPHHTTSATDDRNPGVGP